MSRPVPFKGVHHVELIVGNARQAAYYYRKAFGLSPIAYSGPETGHGDRASYVLGEADIRLVLTTPLSHEDPRNVFLTLHGDGVKDVALEVEDLDAV